MSLPHRMIVCGTMLALTASACLGHAIHVEFRFADNSPLLSAALEDLVECKEILPLPGNPQSSSKLTCPPCGPLYCLNDPALASAIAAKKAEMRARGYPDRLLQLIDRYKCVGCVRSAPDSFRITIEYAPGHYVTDSTGTWSHLTYPWTAQDEARARVELRQGTIKSFYISNSFEACPCCGDKPFYERADYNSTLEINTDGMYVYQSPSDLGPDPQDLQNIPPNLLQELPPIGSYTKPPRRQVHVMCPKCEALAEKYNTLAGQLDSLWDRAISLQIARDTLDRQIIDRENQIANLQYKLNVTGYSYEYQPQIDALEKLNQTDSIQFAADYDKLQAVFKQIADLTAQLTALAAKILQCEKTECQTPSQTVQPPTPQPSMNPVPTPCQPGVSCPPPTPCTPSTPGCTSPTPSDTCQPGATCTNALQPICTPTSVQPCTNSPTAPTSPTATPTVGYPPANLPPNLQPAAAQIYAFLNQLHNYQSPRAFFLNGAIQDLQNGMNSQDYAWMQTALSNIYQDLVNENIYPDQPGLRKQVIGLQQALYSAQLQTIPPQWQSVASQTFQLVQLFQNSLSPKRMLVSGWIEDLLNGLNAQSLDQMQFALMHIGYVITQDMTLPGDPAPLAQVNALRTALYDLQANALPPRWQSIARQIFQVQINVTSSYGPGRVLLETGVENLINSVLSSSPSLDYMQSELTGLIQTSIEHLSMSGDPQTVTALLAIKNAIYQLQVQNLPAQWQTIGGQIFQLETNISLLPGPSHLLLSGAVDGLLNGLNAQSISQIEANLSSLQSDILGNKKLQNPAVTSSLNALLATTATPAESIAIDYSKVPINYPPNKQNPQGPAGGTTPQGVTPTSAQPGPQPAATTPAQNGAPSAATGASSATGTGAGLACPSSGCAFPTPAPLFPGGSVRHVEKKNSEKNLTAVYDDQIDASGVIRVTLTQVYDAAGQQVAIHTSVYDKMGDQVAESYGNLGSPYTDQALTAIQAQVDQATAAYNSQPAAAVPPAASGRPTIEEVIQNIGNQTATGNAPVATGPMTIPPLPPGYSATPNSDGSVTATNDKGQQFKIARGPDGKLVVTPIGTTANAVGYFPPKYPSYAVGSQPPPQPGFLPVLLASDQVNNNGPYATPYHIVWLPPNDCPACEKAFHEAVESAQFQPTPSSGIGAYYGMSISKAQEYLQCVQDNCRKFIGQPIVLSAEGSLYVFNPVSGKLVTLQAYQSDPNTFNPALSNPIVFNGGTFNLPKVALSGGRSSTPSIGSTPGVTSFAGGGSLVPTGTFNFASGAAIAMSNNLFGGMAVATGIQLTINGQTITITFGPSINKRLSPKENPSARRMANFGKAGRLQPASYHPSSRLATPPAIWPQAPASQASKEGKLAQAFTFALKASGDLGSKAFDFQASDPTGQIKQVVIPAGVVLEPLKPPKAKPSSSSAGNARAQSQQLTAYCLEMDKLPPEPGQLYRIAPQALQDKFKSLKSILEAGSKLAEQGQFHPDSEPGAYNDFIRQHALWAKLENWSEQKFTEVFLERTKKNAGEMKISWTKEMEQALKGAAPGRWRDISMVLDEAKKHSSSTETGKASQP